MKYRKKPVVIEAKQWDGSALGAGPIIDWILTNGDTATYHEHLMDGDFIAHPDPYLRIRTLEDGADGKAIHIASVGDYIIKGIQGEFYPCKPDIFEQTYDPVGDDD